MFPLSAIQDFLSVSTHTSCFQLARKVRFAPQMLPIRHCQEHEWKYYLAVKYTKGDSITRKKQKPELRMYFINLCHLAIIWWWPKYEVLETLFAYCISNIFLLIFPWWLTLITVSRTISLPRPPACLLSFCLSVRLSQGFQFMTILKTIKSQWKRKNWAKLKVYRCHWTLSACLMFLPVCVQFLRYRARVCSQ